MSPAERVNILAVDDSADKLLAMSALLSELGENVVTASSGRDALRLLLQYEFAVILLDVRMPDMDGFETAELIRRRKNSEHTPIIFVTAFGDDLLESRGYSLGAVDYLLAPPDPQVLKTKVSVFAELHRKAAQIRSQADELRRQAEQLRKLTQASLGINSALSPDRMLQVVSDFARDILGANQAAAVLALDPTWSSWKSTITFSDPARDLGDWPALRDRQALLSFLSRGSGPVRVPRGGPSPSDGQTEPLGWLGAPMTARDGRRIGLLHVRDKRDGDFNDEDGTVLTQLAQMSSIAIENSLSAEAREANRIKDEFLTTLSHELRTPPSAMMGWTRILRTSQPDSERTAHGLEVIERNLVAQTKLIDDLLDMSRIITGKMRLAVRKTAIASVIQAAMESVRPAAEAKDISLLFEDSVPPEDSVVSADTDRIQQVVWNLLSNGIKFTPARGRVTIRLSRSAEFFQIQVEDTGRGIRQDFLPYVFDRFRQEDSATTRAHTGLGVGLAVARHLVELHGGSIAADSPGEGLGSTFTVLLPAAAAEPKSTAGPNPVPAETPLPPVRGLQSLSGLRILVVEDDPDGRELLEETLRSAGATVAAADAAAPGLALVREFRPDVLVSDIGMAGEDGYWLIERVRGLPPEEGGLVPALAVSAYAREEDRIRSRRAGFQHHLAKPYDPDELLARVSGLGRPRQPDPRPLRILVVDDDNDYRESLKELLEVWGYVVELAESGPQAIDMAIAGRPGVALIDIGLPDVDGYAVAKRLRADLGKDGIYLVALTGYAGDEDRERALSAGFDAHVTKPVNVSTLSDLLAARTAN